MSDETYTAIVTGVVIGVILAVPIITLCHAVRQLTKVIARSKLSLDDYLRLELGGRP